MRKLVVGAALAVLSAGAMAQITTDAEYLLISGTTGAIAGQVDFIHIDGAGYELVGYSFIYPTVWADDIDGKYF